MTEPTKAPEVKADKAPPAPKAAAPKTIKVFPVYSPMHDPHTGVTYGETGVEVLALGPRGSSAKWMQVSCVLSSIVGLL